MYAYECEQRRTPGKLKMILGNAEFSLDKHKYCEENQEGHFWICKQQLVMSHINTIISYLDLIFILSSKVSQFDNSPTVVAYGIV